MSQPAASSFSAGRSGPPAVAEPPYLAGLNPEQRAAVEALDGPLLVLAGAGTGKTRVLTTRLAHLLITARAYPSQVLAVTFTNKAAREMRERVAALIGGTVEGMWIGTFHALAARILRGHAALVGLRPSFTILDADDQLRLIKQLIAAENIDESRWPARTLLAAIERLKDRGLGPDAVSPADLGAFAEGRGQALYRAYQDRLLTVNACDFGDLLLHGLTLFRAHADVLERWQRHFRYILVDEYQDTNVAQYLWLRLLAQGHRNICCVGDDDQSIYSWRGAEVGNILRFEKDFPGAKIIRLERNYRSTRDILGAAAGLIANNQGRLGKTLWTAAEGGEPVAVRALWDGAAEARFVADEVESLRRAGVPYSGVAVLVRASFQMRAFEERFVQIGLPFRVVGGPRFYERQEIRDALAYLRLIHQPADDLAFERIVNVPKRGIGAASLQTVHRLARAARLPLAEAAARLVETDEIKPQARASLRRLLGDFARWRAEAARIDHIELARVVLDESGYTAMLVNDRAPEAPGRLENLKELVAALQEFDGLGAFLEHISLVMDRDDGDASGQVSLMTLHAAKGLEFDVVFLPGWEEGLFPNQRALDQGGSAALEEERRLAYVGLTRARRRAIISFVANRLIYNRWQSSLPSRFVDELPPDHVAAEADPGLYGAGHGRNAASETDGAASWDDAPAGRGPGYARLRAGLRDGAGVIEGTARRVETGGGFAVGTRVFHQKFGYGTVRAADGDKLDILFEQAGAKKVVASFVQPA